MSEMNSTILIIDNDEGMVAAVATRLESLGYRCVTAGTGAQGVAQFDNHDIDLVITDLNMPVGDGISVARTIRETSGVPIIIVTGFREEYLRDLRAIPDVTLVQKPFDTRQLVELVEMHLVMDGGQTHGAKRIA